MFQYRGKQASRENMVTTAIVNIDNDTYIYYEMKPKKEDRGQTRSLYRVDTTVVSFENNRYSYENNNSIFV